MRLMWPSKDPADVADYQINWADLLGADTIASSTWAAPAGFTINSQSNTTTTTTIWLAGGAVGPHRIANTITTSGGRTYERSVDITVEQL